MANQEQGGRLLSILVSKLSGLITDSSIELGDTVIRVYREDIQKVCLKLKSDPELDFNLLIDITAVDWMDSKSERFEVVYHLLSIRHKHRLRIKSWVTEFSQEMSSQGIASVASIWSAANFLERECWDMYGIKFTGHPDLRRILMYDEFVGFPLRKDYPVQHKQPRIPLRSPEVRNTAVDMTRPALVKINRREGSPVSSGGGK